MPAKTILGIYEWPKPGQCGTIICVFKLGFRLLSKSQSSVWQFSKRESGINVAFWKDTRFWATNRSAAVVFLNQIPLDWSSLTHTFLIWTYHIEMSAAKTIKFGFPKHKTTTNKQIFRRSNVLWLLEQKHFSDRIHNHSLQHDNCGREIFGIRESEIGEDEGMRRREELVKSHCVLRCCEFACSAPSAPTAACRWQAGGYIAFLNVQCTAWIYRNVGCSSNGLANFVRPREFVKEDVWCTEADGKAGLHDETRLDR